ncbi:FAD-dependent monooxygenase [Paraburkholderia sp. A1RI-2L]|uniref:FAD-dependent monooxygenase n=1 Tax=Paraburkholderia sp. A1RI-2L TaxID=3028367 RepID=UPI003B77561B
MRIEHPPSTLGTRTRFFNIYQPTMEATLRECATRHAQIDVRYGMDVVSLDQDETGVTLTAKDVATDAKTSVRVRYAIGCDGGSSATRGALGVKLLGDTLEVLWIVIDCRVKRWRADRNLLTFWSDKERPVVDVALSGGNHRWELPLKPGETEADFSTNEQVWPLFEALGVSADDVEIHQHAFYRHRTRMDTISWSCDPRDIGVNIGVATKCFRMVGIRSILVGTRTKQRIEEVSCSFISTDSVPVTR